MGRYLLFAGDAYYPGGGWSDYQGSFSSVKAALDAVRATRKVIVHPARIYTTDKTMALSSCTGLSYLASPDRPWEPKVGELFGGGRILSVDGDRFSVEVPERTEVSYDYDWAHVVHRERIVAEWGGE